MIALIQRVNNASVTVDNKLVSQIDRGFLILLGIYQEDTENQSEFLAEKTSKLRIFCDSDDKMNLSPKQLLDSGQKVQMLVVSQFTLCAQCKGQNRPSFINAAKPEIANKLYMHYVGALREKYGFDVKSGIFGADMKVALENDGPVTIILDTDNL